MSRYKKILLGEIETKEINGTKYLLYPTLEHRAEALEIFKDAQVEVTKELTDGSKETKKGNFDLPRVIKICSDIVYEGCYDHDEKGNRKQLKTEEKDVTYDDIKFNVIQSGVFELYLEIAGLLNIIDKNKKKEIDTKIKQVDLIPQ